MDAFFPRLLLPSLRSFLFMCVFLCHFFLRFVSSSLRYFATLLYYLNSVLTKMGGFYEFMVFGDGPYLF